MHLRIDGPLVELINETGIVYNKSNAFSFESESENRVNVKPYDELYIFLPESVMKSISMTLIL
jgi:hypothetical protein